MCHGGAIADQTLNADNTECNELRTLDAAAPEAQMLNIDVALRMRSTFIDQAI